MMKAVFSVLAAQLVLFCAKVEEARGACREAALAIYDVRGVVLSTSLDTSGELVYSVRVEDVESSGDDRYDVAYGRGPTPEEAFAAACESALDKAHRERTRREEYRAAQEAPGSTAGWTSVGTDTPQ